MQAVHPARLALSGHEEAWRSGAEVAGPKVQSQPADGTSACRSRMTTTSSLIGGGDRIGALEMQPRGRLRAATAGIVPLSMGLA